MLGIIYFSPKRREREKIIYFALARPNIENEIEREIYLLFVLKFLEKR